MSGHTKGPWGVSGRHPVMVMGPPHSKQYPGRPVIAALGDASRGDNVDNAHLIAAAPDLLAALERALKDLNDPLHVAGCIDNPTDRPCCWVYEARRAIEKARGE